MLQNSDLYTLNQFQIKSDESIAPAISPRGCKIQW